MPKVWETFGNADQIVGDQVEQEVGSDSGNAAVGLAHCAVVLAPPENAFDHRTPALGHPVAKVPRGAPTGERMSFYPPAPVATPWLRSLPGSFHQSLSRSLRAAVSPTRQLSTVLPVGPAILIGGGASWLDIEVGNAIRRLHYKAGADKKHCKDHHAKSFLLKYRIANGKKLFISLTLKIALISPAVRCGKCRALPSVVRGPRSEVGDLTQQPLTPSVRFVDGVVPQGA
jgi:hypothetical protein